jgi:excinuclease ABC subunit A
MPGKKPVIEVRGARVNNLKNVDVDVPRDSFVVITGLSGSGKSSFAFDTLYAEANRRYVESLSSYARNFMEAFDKPDVDAVHNLIPAISIDQKSVSRSPRSTVGTMTEVYDYLRLLYAKEGVPHCSSCGEPLSKKTVQEILAEILSFPNETPLAFLSIPESFSGKSASSRLALVSEWGYVRVRMDGIVMPLSDAEASVSGGAEPERIEVAVDRLVLDTARPDKERILDSLETALRIGSGSMTLLAGEEERLYKNLFLCEACGMSLPDFVPSSFSFNSPDGACPRCSGLGITLEFDPDLVIPNQNLSILEGAIRPLAKTGGERGTGSGPTRMLEELARVRRFSLSVPVRKLSKKHLDAVFSAVIPILEQKYREARSDHFRTELEECMRKKICSECGGKRLRPESLAVRIDGYSIHDIATRSVASLRPLLRELSKRYSGEAKRVTDLIFHEMESRLYAVEKVCLGYLDLSRSADTLSGGEAQRIRLSVQMRSGLSGILYILDEPSVGLHPRDTDRLTQAILELKEGGNSLVVVEHDRAIMKSADYIIDFGPGAGRQGGEVIFAGTPEKLMASKSTTGSYLSEKKHVSEKKSIREGNGRYLSVIGATEHNLKNIDIRIPLGKFVAVSGVSGSGKSSLVDDILSRVLAKHFYGALAEPGKHGRVEGLDHIDKVITVNQDPIGRTPRSNAATYTGVFNYIRDLYAATPEAEKEKFDASHFSFNMKGGRCEACQGAGVKKIEMYLLPDMYALCEVCLGSRYGAKTLSVIYRGMNISQVLRMTVSEARVFFLDQPQVEEKLRTLEEVGLGYLVLGQSAPTLSGGEAQRVKLATELSRKSSGNTLYILDEPTIGLHFEDTRRLLDVLDALVDKGNTVLVVEHSTDIINHADWVIELGPDGGVAGGELIFEGTPEKLKKCKKSPTAKYL